MPAAIVKPFDYQRRIWNGSGLTNGETLVAAYLAYLALTSADADGWFSVSKAAICEATKIRKRDTVAKYLDALAAKGWTDTYKPTVAGRYQSGRYRLTLPGPRRLTPPATPARRAHETGTETGHRAHETGMASMPTQRAIFAHPAGNEVRSTSNVVVDGAPPSGDGDDDKGNPAASGATRTPIRPPARVIPRPYLLGQGCHAEAIDGMTAVQRNRLCGWLLDGEDCQPHTDTARQLVERGYHPAEVRVLTDAQRLQLLNGVPVRPPLRAS